MGWPTISDYNDAIQNPQICFKDVELKQGTPKLNKLGLPVPVSGGFASVYQIINQHKNKQYAVRCFSYESRDYEMRYAAIGSFLKKAQLPYTVGFDFLQEGIKVKGQWYPILKMEWLNGYSLSKYIESNINNKQELARLSGEFVKMLEKLQQFSIAHGDLQHGNILIVNKEFKLIDYDSMYVPDLSGLKSYEIGHPNYQHPNRTGNDFGEYLDNFSGWIIYLSLLGLSIDPELWKKRSCQDGEQLLFSKKDDFHDFKKSKTLQLLSVANNAILRNLSLEFQNIVSSTAQTLPKNIPSVISVLSKTGNTTSSSSKIPSWMHDHLDIKTSQTTNKVPSWMHEDKVISPLFEEIKQLANPNWLTDNLTKVGLRQESWLEVEAFHLPTWASTTFEFKPIVQWKSIAKNPISFSSNSLVKIEINTKSEKIALVMLFFGITIASFTSVWLGLIVGLLGFSGFFISCFYNLHHSKEFLELKGLMNKLQNLERKLDEEKKSIYQEIDEKKQHFSYFYENTFSNLKMKLNHTLEEGKQELRKIDQERDSKLKKFFNDNLNIKEEANKQFIKLHQKFEAKLIKSQENLKEIEKNKQEEKDIATKELKAQFLIVENKKRELDNLEKAELQRIEQTLSNHLSLINTKRKNLEQQEATQIKQITHEEKTKFLEQYTLDKSSISGINDILKSRLKLKGVYSAADIENTYDQGGQSFIKTRTSHYVRVEGIGSKKATELLNWRNRLVSYFNSHNYPSIEQKIKQKYILENKEVNLQEGDAKREFQQKRVETEKRFREKHQQLVQERNNIEQQNAERIKKIDENYQQKYNSLISEAKRIPNDFKQELPLFLQKYQQELRTVVTAWENTCKASSEKYLEKADKYSKEVLYLQREVEKAELEFVAKHQGIEQDIEIKENQIHRQVLDVEELKNKLLCYENVKFRNHLKRILTFK